MILARSRPNDQNSDRGIETGAGLSASDEGGVVRTTRIPTEELKPNALKCLSWALPRPNDQNSDRGIETQILAPT